jgi:CelD/BcsL family acetyltransferase involved in cellulose biosynthesis
VTDESRQTPKGIGPAADESDMKPGSAPVIPLRPSSTRTPSGAPSADSPAPLVEVERRLATLAPEWDDLAGRVGATPFMRPGWMTAWWHAFGTGDPAIMTARRNGRLTGILPLERHRGALRALANQHTPSYNPIAEDDASARALVDRALATTARRVELSMLDRWDIVSGALLEAATERGRRTYTRIVRRTPYLTIDSDWAGILANLSRRHRKELRRQRRRLEEIGPVGLETISGRAELEQGFADLLALEGSGWKVERGTAIASRPETRSFYQEVAVWAAERGYLALFFLTVGGKRVAVDLCLDHMGVRYMLKGGFLPEYAGFSPGTLLLEANLAQGVAAGLKRIELGGGSDSYKLRWTQSTSKRWQIQAFSESPAGRVSMVLHTNALPLARRLRDRWASRSQPPGPDPEFGSALGDPF